MSRFSIKLSGEAGTERVKGKIEFMDMNDEAAKKDHAYPAQATSARVALIGFFITRSERNSEFGMHEQTYLVES